MPCPKCEENVAVSKGESRYMYQVEHEGQLFIWNVSAAMDLINNDDKRPLIELPEAAIKAYLEINVVDEEHVQHVSTERPGIVAIFPNGMTALIDGSHRAARCLREGKPFFVRPLWYLESIYCQSLASI